MSMPPFVHGNASHGRRARMEGRQPPHGRGVEAEVHKWRLGEKAPPARGTRTLARADLGIDTSLLGTKLGLLYVGGMRRAREPVACGIQVAAQAQRLRLAEAV